MIAAISTETESIASLYESNPLATKESELTSFPFFLTYNPKINFTTIPAIKIIKVILLYSGISGWTTFLKDSINAVNPAYKTVTKGSNYGTLPKPEPTAGYTFTGWYTESSGGTKIQDSTTVETTAPQILYAQCAL